LSVASLWEIAIKFSLGKLTLGKPFDEIIPEQLTINDITILPIDTSALNQVSNLPFHHRDPFDRMIIAQAIAETMSVIGKDAIFSSYDIKLIWNNEPV
jgi:PIN domain nuclease of toxin-antitoxin system